MCVVAMACSKLVTPYNIGSATVGVARRAQTRALPSKRRRAEQLLRLLEVLGGLARSSARLVGSAILRSQAPPGQSG